MPEIGATLREARMRARIDISEIETETKIRAKYLRALENEEWDLLPGPTYVKSFLRTYAEALGLDAKLIVDEYKVRHERLSDVEMQPISPAAPGRERRRQPSGPIVPRWAVVVAIFAGLIVALYALGSSGDDDPADTGRSASPPVTTPVTSADGDRSERRRPKRRRATRVRLQIVAIRPVNVCLRAGRKVLVRNETLQAGDKTKTFRAKGFAMTLGNNGARLRINGKSRSLAESSNGIGLRITPRRGRRPLSPTQRPTCGG